MKDALANDECPLDAKLENVIPGLHQWHRANDQALKSVVETVNSHMAGLKETLTSIQEGQVVGVNNIKEVIANSFLRAAVSISPNTNPVSRLPPPCPQRRQYDSGLDELADLFDSESPAGFADEQTPGAAAGTDKIFLMKAKHPDLKSLYQEWYGLGSFCDGSGGIAAREKAQGAAWRKEISAHHFSRTRRIVEAIDSVMARESKSWEEAVAQLQPMFARSKQSTSNMIINLQKAGIINTGKPRGTKRKSVEAFHE
jgi:hypothetical protein